MNEKIKVWIGEDGMGDGWEELSDEERDDEMERLGHLCIEYGADEWEAVPDTFSYPHINTAAAQDIVDEAFAAWCGGADTE